MAYELSILLWKFEEFWFFWRPVAPSTVKLLTLGRHVAHCKQKLARREARPAPGMTSQSVGDSLGWCYPSSAVLDG